MEGPSIAAEHEHERANRLSTTRAHIGEKITRGSGNLQPTKEAGLTEDEKKRERDGLFSLLSGRLN